MEDLLKKVREILEQFSDGFTVKQSETSYELTGKKDVIVGKKTQKMFFASVAVKKGFVGFYFFPIYTHPEEFKDIPELLRKSLKGKSCFHLKKNDPELLKQVDHILRKGLKLYRKLDWA